MNTDVYFKKVYTVAFRLTGDEEAACELAAEAAIKSSDVTGGINNNITDGAFKSAALEVCRLFLEKQRAYSGGEAPDIPMFYRSKDMTWEIQKAVLELEPLNRTLIIWKDMLGFQLSDLPAITNTGLIELKTALFRARMQIKKNPGISVLF